MDSLTAQDKTATGLSGRQVEPGVVLEFAQRLVAARHAHYEHDPFFEDSEAEAVGKDSAEEGRDWEWCPSGLPDGSLPDENEAVLMNLAQQVRSRCFLDEVTLTESISTRFR